MFIHTDGQREKPGFVLRVCTAVFVLLSLYLAVCQSTRVASCCFWLLVASCQLQVAAGAAVVVAGVRSGGAKNKLHVIIVAATCCTYQKKPSKQPANSRQTN